MMDFRYLIIRRNDLAMIQTNELSPEDIRHCELNVIYLVDLVTITEYRKGEKWVSIKNGNSKEK